MAIHPLVRLRNAVFYASLFLLASVLLSCSSNTLAPVNNMWDEVKTTQSHYLVKPGDTLYTIAWRFNLNDEALAGWNQLQKPYTVHVGQMLRLTAPSSSLTLDSRKPPVAKKIMAPPVQFTPSDRAPVSSNKALKLEQPNNLSAPLQTTSEVADIKGTGNWPWPAKGKLLATYGQKENKGIDLALPVGSKIKAVQPGIVVYAGANLHGYGQLLIIKQKDNLITAYAHNSKLLVAEGAHVVTGQDIALSGNTESTTPMLHFEVRKLGKTVNPLQYLSSS